MAQIVGQHRGDVVGFQFPGEQQIVLFAPESGDVMSCPIADWQGMTINPHSSLITALRALNLSLD